MPALPLPHYNVAISFYSQRKPSQQELKNDSTLLKGELNTNLSSFEFSKGNSSSKRWSISLQMLAKGSPRARHEPRISLFPVSRRTLERDYNRSLCGGGEEGGDLDTHLTIKVIAVEIVTCRVVKAVDSFLLFIWGIRLHL